MPYPYCPACMMKKKPNEPCGHCGFDVKDYETPKTALPIGARLGHFQAGVLLGQSRQAQCYIGIDCNTEKPVLIEEFFPFNVLGRHAGKPGTSVVGDAANFERAKAQFAGARAREDQAEVVLENGTAYRVHKRQKKLEPAQQAADILEKPVMFHAEDGAPKLSINALTIPAMPAVETRVETGKKKGLFSRGKRQSPEFELKATALSHIGCVRKNNEDNFFLNGDIMPLEKVNDGAYVNVQSDDDVHLLAICDGMGGLELGEQASYEAVSRMEALRKRLRRDKPEEAIREFAAKASAAIQKDVERAKGKREGTTLAMLCLVKETATIANVGDSRVYLLRGGKLMQLSLDHSEVFSMVLAGKLTLEQARNHPRNNMISRYLGMKTYNPQMASIRSVEACRGDRFLICSDGLSDLLGQAAIEALLPGGTTEEAARRLVEHALIWGGKDNTTVIVADYDGALPGPEERQEELDIVHLNRDATTGQ